MATEDYDWYAKADLSKFRGKWVAVLNKQIVASSEDLKSLSEEVGKRYPKSKPLFAKIPREKRFVW